MSGERSTEIVSLTEAEQGLSAYFAVEGPMYTEGAVERIVAARAAAARDDEWRRFGRLANAWEGELRSGAIRDESARYCWGLAVQELRATIAGAHPLHGPVSSRPGGDDV